MRCVCQGYIHEQLHPPALEVEGPRSVNRRGIDVWHIVVHRLGWLIRNEDGVNLHNSPIGLHPGRVGVPGEPIARSNPINAIDGEGTRPYIFVLLVGEGL